MALIVLLAFKILLFPYQLLILIQFYLLAFTKLILTFFYYTFLDARNCTYKFLRACAVGYIKRKNNKKTQSTYKILLVIFLKLTSFWREM